MSGGVAFMVIGLAALVLAFGAFAVVLRRSAPRTSPPADSTRLTEVTGLGVASGAAERDTGQLRDQAQADAEQLRNRAQADADQLRDRAQADAERAIALAPEMAEGHVALSQVLEWNFLDFVPAVEECRRAVALAPGSAPVVRWCSGVAADMGQFDSAIAEARHPRPSTRM